MIVPESRAPEFLEPGLSDRASDPLRSTATGRDGRRVRGYFTPDETCLVQFEAGLETFLQHARGVPAGLCERQRSYKRQYAGFVTDQRRLFVTSFCREIDSWPWSDYSYSAGTISGGRDCYFDVVFGCDDRKYGDFVMSDEPSP